jgi:hypothetical protein
MKKKFAILYNKHSNLSVIPHDETEDLETIVIHSTGYETEGTAEWQAAELGLVNFYILPNYTKE